MYKCHIVKVDFIILGKLLAHKSVNLCDNDLFIQKEHSRLRLVTFLFHFTQIIQVNSYFHQMFYKHVKPVEL